jgi:hypothetical protein
MALANAQMRNKTSNPYAMPEEGKITIPIDAEKEEAIFCTHVDDAYREALGPYNGWFLHTPHTIQRAILRDEPDISNPRICYETVRNQWEIDFVHGAYRAQGGA